LKKKTNKQTHTHTNKHTHTHKIEFLVKEKKVAVDTLCGEPAATSLYIACQVNNNIIYYYYFYYFY